MRQALEASLVATAVTAFIEEKEIWEGTPAELLAELNQVAERLKISTKARGWPSSPVWLSRQLSEVQAKLGKQGILAERGRGKSRSWLLTKISENTDAPNQIEPQIGAVSSDSKDGIFTILERDGYVDFYLPNGTPVSCARLLDEWRRRGCPPITIRPGEVIRDLELYLASLDAFGYDPERLGVVVKAFSPAGADEY